MQRRFMPGSTRERTSKSVDYDFRDLSKKDRNIDVEAVTSLENNILEK